MLWAHIKVIDNQRTSTKRRDLPCTVAHKLSESSNNAAKENACKVKSEFVSLPVCSIIISHLSA